jgi:hypothetical protein
LIFAHRYSTGMLPNWFLLLVIVGANKGDRTGTGPYFWHKRYSRFFLELAMRIIATARHTAKMRRHAPPATISTFSSHT